MSTTSSITFIAMFFLLVSTGLLDGKPTQKKNEAEVTCEGVAVYQVTLETFWSKTSFPKQFPMYRPQAQWSKLVGRTHDSRYKLWSEGELASEAVKQFTEKSLTSDLDSDTQGMMGVFDDFISPSIISGEGTSVANVYLQGQHSKLSVIVRMVPSPDWFIGVDSLDLCDSTGQWVSEQTVDLDPMDAGTDRGMTFSAPDWIETPARPISRITSKLPNHPANSFFYPDLDKLPPVARLMVQKIEFDEAAGGNVEVVEVIERKDIVPAARSLQTISKLNEMKQRYATSGAVTKPESSAKQARLVAPAARGVAAGRLDCAVTEWTEWSECSKTCGFGVRTRSRSVLQPPQNHGQICPSLKDNQICGTMRSCDYKPFSSNNWNNNGRAARPALAAKAA